MMQCTSVRSNGILSLFGTQDSEFLKDNFMQTIPSSVSFYGLIGYELTYKNLFVIFLFRSFFFSFPLPLLVIFMLDC